MSLVARIILSLCVLAGMASGMIHTAAHQSHDECAHSHHDHDATGDLSHSHSHDDSEHPDTPHHHDCCHYPSADQPMMEISLTCSFITDLVKISNEHSLVPEEPLFLLDKPPLI